MTRLYVLVEGDTELAFVKRTLAPHLDSRTIWTTPIEVTTRRDRRTRAKLGRGGGHWRHWKKDLETLIRTNRGADVRFTTLFDLYGLPDDFPDLDRYRLQQDTAQRAYLLETAMSDAIKDWRFIPYLQRHEFEALVLAVLDQLENLLEDKGDVDGLAQLRASVANLGPEDINDGEDTAPSKRLLSFIPSYQKTVHGPLVTEAAGLTRLRAACPRFSQWVEKLEALGETAA
jgi:hypothetical protein